MYVCGCSGLCAFDTLCPVAFLVVCGCWSALMQSVVMLYVDCGVLG